MLSFLIIVSNNKPNFFRFFFLFKWMKNTFFSVMKKIIISMRAIFLSSWFIMWWDKKSEYNRGKENLHRKNLHLLRGVSHITSLTRYYAKYMQVYVFEGRITGSLCPKFTITHLTLITRRFWLNEHFLHVKSFIQS